MKTLLRVHTPRGIFNRKTAIPYTHVCVREPIIGAPAFCDLHAMEKSGVKARYLKDRGYILTWHRSESAARAKLDKQEYVASCAVGVYPVSQG